MTEEKAAEILTSYAMPNGIGFPEVKEAAKIGVKAIIVLDALKDQITSIKRNAKSDNNDYLTGYICALSAVEGVIAEVNNE